MISAMINATISASRTAIITKNCVWVGEVDAAFFEGTDVAVKKTAAINKILVFTLGAPIISRTLHVNSET